MYHEFYGLRQAPFKITPDTKLFFNGGHRGEILEALVYAISSGEGIVKVVGEVGSGKTMLCRMLEVRLPDQVEIVYLPNPSLTPEDILHNIALEMGLEVNPAANRIHVMQDLHHCLLERHANNQRVVVFVEEAQAMPLETLEEIRLLSNLETQQDKLLQIVLFGQPELDKNLNVRSIRQLRERITHSFNLPPLTAENIQEYVRFRLNAVGYRGPDMFDHGAYKAIAAASRGLTRRVNILADKSLLAAFAENTHKVSRKHALKAIADSEMKANREIAKPLLASVAGVAAVAVITWVVLSGVLAPTFESISALWRSDTPQTAAQSVADAEPAVEANASAEQVSAAESAEAPVQSVAQITPATDTQAEQSEGSQMQDVVIEPADNSSAVSVAAVEATVAEALENETTAAVVAVESDESAVMQTVDSASTLITTTATQAVEAADDSLAALASDADSNSVALTPSDDLALEVGAATQPSEQASGGALETSDSGAMTDSVSRVVDESETAEASEQPEVVEAVMLETNEVTGDVALADNTAEIERALPDVELPSGSELLKQRLLAARSWMASADRSSFTIQLLATDISQGASLEEFLRAWRSIGRLDRIYVYRTKIRGGRLVWRAVRRIRNVLGCS